MPRLLLSELELRGRNKSIHKCKIWALILKEEIILAGETQDIPSATGWGLPTSTWVRGVPEEVMPVYGQGQWHCRKSRKGD